jgi:hypothetical protein
MQLIELAKLNSINNLMHEIIKISCHDYDF